MIVRKIIKWNWIQIIRLLWIIFRYLIFQVSSLCSELKYSQPPVNFSSEILGVLSSSKQGPSSLCIWKSLFSRWERKIAYIILLKKKSRLETWARKGVTAAGIQPICLFLYHAGQLKLHLLMKQFHTCLVKIFESQES